MKRLLIILISAVFCVALTLFGGCVLSGSDGQAGTEQETTDGNNDEKEITAMYVYVNGNKLKVELAKNSSADALVELLKSGDIVFTAYENGGFEIYGNIGHNLPTNNSQITAQAGDVILYAGNNICLFFGNNSWSYTRIGKINGYSADELRTLLGAGGGSVQVTLSLN